MEKRSILHYFLQKKNVYQHIPAHTFAVWTESFSMEWTLQTQCVFYIFQNDCIQRTMIGLLLANLPVCNGAHLMAAYGREHKIPHFNLVGDICKLVCEKIK